MMPLRVEEQREPHRWGKVPIRNIWLLMLYASGLFRELAGRPAPCAVEENPDDIPGLVAEFLAHQVERRILNNLTCRYTQKRAVLKHVRGRIDALYTARNSLLEQAKVACRVEDFTPDTPRNRLVCAALEHMGGIVADPFLSRRCTTLARALRRRGVVCEKPSRASLSADRFGQNDRLDRPMVSAALLAFDLLLPLQQRGQCDFAGVEQSSLAFICRLYEKAVAGFYRVVAPAYGWKVQSGIWQSWQTEQPSEGILGILPKMQLDIRLDHREKRRRIVIDTKFNAITAPGRRREVLRSAYLYQMYAYLRSQEAAHNPEANHAEGLLLHPSLSGELTSESVRIQGHTMRFATVDLTAEASSIRGRLLSFLEEPTETARRSAL